MTTGAFDLNWLRRQLAEREGGITVDESGWRFIRDFIAEPVAQWTAEQVLVTDEIIRKRSLSRYIVQGGLTAMQYALSLGWRTGDSFPGLHMPTVTDSRGRGEWKLRWWGLAREIAGRDESGHGPLLALTPDGVRFFQGRLRVHKTALMRVRSLRNYPEFTTSEEPIGLEGELVSVHDVLGESFDLRELRGTMAP